MTVTAGAPSSGPLHRAAELVDTGLRACEAYERPDLGARLRRAQHELADPSVHAVVVGEFKQGKSSLVNALVGARVCPVDDDVATAVPTYVRHGDEARAELIYQDDPPRREPIDIAQVRRWAVEDGPGGAIAPATGGADRLTGVEIRLPRKLLGGGLVLVDTPGVGGLGSAHAAATLMAASMAGALVFVTDASQELTRSERDFLRQAREMCDIVVCALTKTDFYPFWRKVRELTAEHLRDGLDMRIIPVSSTLRAQAVAAGDTELNEESGFPELVRFLLEQVSGRTADRMAAHAATQVALVCRQLEAQFAAERAALERPEEADRVVAELRAVKERVEALKSAAAKWNQTLTDGIADLNSDIDHDLKARVKDVIAQADTAIEGADPADVWAEMESWLQARVAHEMLANYTLLRDRSTALSEEVGEHFRAASGDVLEAISVSDPLPTVTATEVDHKIELERMTVGKQAMVALKSAYGGAIMFIMLGTLAGISLTPIAVGIGLVMGRKGLRDEKKRQRAARQTQARNAVRRYCDEVSFALSKDSRDSLRTIQRQLRDHYTGIAEELDRSNAEALRRASDSVTSSKAEREQRLGDIDAELARLAALREHATAVAP